MRNVRLVILISGFLVLLAVTSSCSPSSVNSSSAGLPVTGGKSTASALVLSAPTTTIAPGGTTTITARVVDNLGNNVSDGTVVNFSFAPGDQIKASLSASSATTVNGLASVTVTGTSTTNAIAVINAFSGNASGSIAITITTATGGGGTGTVTVTASPSQVPVNSSSAITATVKDSSGNAVSGASVNFSLSNSNGILSITSALTNTTGAATVQLTGSVAGQVTVTAAVPSLSGIQGAVTVTVQQASTTPTLTVTATSTTMLTNSSVTINALLSGPSLTLSNQTVSFSVSNSAVATLASTTGVTDAYGLASVSLTSLNIASPVTVTVSYAGQGQNLQGTVTITISAPPPDNITVSANPNPISVYATTTITATVTGAGQNVPDGTFVSFVLSDSTFGSLSSTSGSTVNGKATTSFIAVGKAGTVSITGVAGSVSYSAVVTISPAQTGSIQFVSAVPQVIGIQGSGQPETSTVTFAVKDVNGNAVVDGTLVTFTMLGPGGGAYIGNTPGSTTCSSGTVGGKASAILHSGTVAGPVTVIASTNILDANGNILSTISSSASQISIGGGVPSGGHWNLATSLFNLPGLSYSNEQATISAYIADRFGNYNILKGTSISFYTEAGAIDRQGTTDQTGAASVVIRTQAPDPADVPNALALSAISNYYFGGLAEPWYAGGSTWNNNPRDGWVTVLATTLGEEGFVDENGDGLFTKSTSTTDCPPGYTCECDGGTPGGYAGYVASGNCSTGGKDYNGNNVTPGGKRSEGFIDIGEPFYDVNDNGVRDDGSVAGSPFELFIDANSNGVYDGPNGKWDGPECTTTGCLTSKMIWSQIKLVFTGGEPFFYPLPDATNNYAANSFASGYFAVAPPSISRGGAGNFAVIVGDQNLNTLMPGTTITASASPGSVSPTSITTMDGLSKGPTGFAFSVSINSTETKSVTVVTITVTTPKGLTVYTSISVPLI